MKFLFLILLSLIPLQAHERYYPDTDIGHVAGIILEGEIIKKTERVLHELKKDDEVILSLEITYSFKIQRVIRGDYKDGSILKMQENLYVQGDENRGSYNTGDQFRYFYNFGEFEGDTFIPFSTATQKLIKSDTYKFPVTKNSARPHLYEYSGLDEGNRASSLSTTPQLGDLGRKENQITKSESKGEKVTSFSWLIIGLVGLILIIAFLLRKGKT